jgi:hypothetical protein
LATKAHFSSNWTSCVAGGKSHDLVVGVVGVGAGLGGVPADGVFIDAHEATGLADAAPLLEVLQDRDGFLPGQAGGEQGGALALGEARLAGAADEHPAAPLAVAEANAEVVAAT